MTHDPYRAPDDAIALAPHCEEPPRPRRAVCNACGKPLKQDDWSPMFGNPIGPWHGAFAWRPVWTHDFGWVWLRRVWRRQIQKHQFLDGGADFWWQYRRSVLQ